MHSCYIIDDDRHAVDALTHYVEQIPGLSVIGGATNPLYALQEINSGKRPDIVFLDVQMPELSGLALAEMLGKDTLIVFTTGYAKYAVDAFEKNAVDFLLKPISFERFERSASKVLNVLKEKEHNSERQKTTLMVNAADSGSVVQIKIDDIRYVEVGREFLTIHFAEDQCQTRLSLETVLQELPEVSFRRVNREVIVNLRFIRAYVDDKLTMMDGRIFIVEGGTNEDCGNMPN